MLRKKINKEGNFSIWKSNKDWTLKKFHDRDFVHGHFWVMIFSFPLIYSTLWKYAANLIPCSILFIQFMTISNYFSQIFLNFHICLLAMTSFHQLLQVILFEIDCAIFYTNLHELFFQLTKLGKFWQIYGQLLNIMSSYGCYQKGLRWSHNY